MLRTSYVLGVLDHSLPKVRRMENLSSAGELDGVGLRRLGVGIPCDRKCSFHVLIHPLTSSQGCVGNMYIGSRSPLYVSGAKEIKNNFVKKRVMDTEGESNHRF